MEMLQKSHSRRSFSMGEKRSLIDVRIESFQFLPVHLSLDVPKTEISNLVTRLRLFQQSSITQDTNTISGMYFADADIASSRTGRTCKFAIQVSTVKTQQCSISRMKPRSKRQGIPVGPSWHTIYYHFPATNNHPIYSLRIRRITLLVRRYKNTLTMVSVVKGDHPDETVCTGLPGNQCSTEPLNAI